MKKLFSLIIFFFFLVAAGNAQSIVTEAELSEKQNDYYLQPTNRNGVGVKRSLPVSTLQNFFSNSVRSSINSKKQVVSSISELQTFTDSNIADFDGSTWILKSGNESSDGNGYAGTKIRKNSQYYWQRITDYITPKMFGAVNDSTTINNSFILNAINANKKGHIIFPNGVYIIDNSSGYLAISDFHGKISFEGNAKLVFTDSTKGGIEFSSCSNIIVENLKTEYSKPPKSRGYYYAIHVYNSHDVVFRNINVNSSLGAGLLFNECIRPTVYNVKIKNTMADGLHFSNCQNSYIDGLETYNTGDDGLAFVNYATNSNYKGGYATNIRVRKSFARGIAIAGQSDVVVTNFLIDSTASSGLYVAYESFWNLRVPDNVSCSNGIITNAGWVANVGSRNGIEYSAIKKLKLDNIKVVNPYFRGFAGSGSLADINANNIEIINATRAEGINLIGKSAVLNNINVENTLTSGIWLESFTNVDIKNVVVSNVSSGGGLNRAIWFENNASVFADGLTVIDKQSTAKGYIVGAYNTTSGKISNVRREILNGTFSYSIALSGIVVDELELSNTFGSKLSTSSNLSDLSNILTARSNLGLGNLSTTNVSTNLLSFLSSPSSANFQSSLTTKTGTGLLVFNNSPNFEGSIGVNGPIYSGTVQASGDIKVGATAGRAIVSESNFMKLNYSKDFSNGIQFQNDMLLNSTGKLSLGTLSPHPSAKFHINSTDKGFLMPTMTTSEKNAIVSPAIGLLVFDTILGQFSYWNGTMWKNLITD